MVEVKVKVKVKVSGKSEKQSQKQPPKKTRKPRKDKGIKRGKRGTGPKKPQFQTGSIDFRTIGTQQTSNATLLAGLIASRAVVPQYLQPQQPQQTSTELTRYAPRDLPRNVPPPQFRPDSEQGQEEVSQATQVRQAMGERIGRLRKEAEDLEEKEAILYVKSKGLERRNLQMEEQGKKLQEELTMASEKVKEQKNELIKGANFLQQSDLRRALSAEELEGATDLTDMRSAYLMAKGLKVSEDYTFRAREGARGKAAKEFDIVPIQKQDLQRAQEERPPPAVREIQDEEEMFDEEPSTTSIQKEFKQSVSPRSPRGKITEARRSEERAAEAIQEIKRNLGTLAENKPKEKMISGVRVVSGARRTVPQSDGDY